MRRQALTALAALAAATCTLTGCGGGAKPVAAHSAVRATPNAAAQFDASLRSDADAIRRAVTQLAALLHKPRTDGVYARAAAALVTALQREKTRLGYLTPPAQDADTFATIRTGVDEWLNAVQQIAKGAANGSTAKRAQLAALLRQATLDTDTLTTAVRAAGVKVADMPTVSKLPSAVTPRPTVAPSSAAPARDTAALTHTAWTTVSYPMDCSPVGYLVLATHY